MSFRPTWRFSHLLNLIVCGKKLFGKIFEKSKMPHFGKMSFLHSKGALCCPSVFHGKLVLREIKIMRSTIRMKALKKVTSKSFAKSKTPKLDH